MKSNNVTGVLCALLAGIFLMGASYGDDEAIVMTIPNGVPQDVEMAQNAVCRERLCNMALQGLWNLVDKVTSKDHIRTCYCHEGRCPAGDVVDQPSGSDLPSDLALNLFPADSDIEPFAYTDCSGWVSYLLNVAADQYASGYEDVRQYPLAQNSGTYIKAFAYQNFFRMLAEEKLSSDYWQGYQDLTTLQSGDILAWCIDQKNKGETATQFCQYDVNNDNDIPIGKDSGHIMLVLAVANLGDGSDSNLPGKLASSVIGDDETLEYFQIAVMDSSSVAHTNNVEFAIESQDGQTGNSITFLDSRTQYGNIPLKKGVSKACKAGSYGGLGTGTIYIAQIKKNDGSAYRWSLVFKNTKTFKTPIAADADLSQRKSYERYEIAYGRIAGG